MSAYVHKALARPAIAFGSIVIVAFALIPFIWMIIASITPEASAEGGDAWSSVRAVQYWPSQPTLSNYWALFETVPFLDYFRNSFIVATGTTILATSVASLGAYGFVRFRFHGRAQILFGMLLAYMVPTVVLLVPLMVIFRTYGLINTYPGLILAESTIAAPFELLLMINTSRLCRAT
jgi:ABC-type glycerol-3-phosphate transport system permease component